MEETKSKLLTVEPNKEKKIKRIKLKIQNLSLIKKLIEERGTFEDSLKAGVRWYDRQKEDKATQTEQIKTKIQEAQIEELVEHKLPGS
jgi:hypothetical protein